MLHARSFIAALLWPSSCLHVLEINELLSELPAWQRVRANTADLTGPCYAAHQSPHPASHQQPTWWMSTLSTAGQTVSSIPLTCLSFPFCPLPLRSVCLTVRLSPSLSVSLFKALLYSFHSLSIALEANSQSQWAWVTRDKYNIAYNACKLHTYGCMFTMHV